MPRTRPPLPDFEQPPVIEVALSIQFERLAQLRAPHLGLLWTEFQDKFPFYEDHAPLDHIVETFGVRQPPKLGIQLVAGDAPPVVRCWFLNEPRTELIQVQQDRFVHNWRKIGVGVKEGEEYPHYEHISEQFEKELEVFKKFVVNNNIGKFIPNQCEITYINHIVAGEGWNTHDELSEVVSIWSSDFSEPFPLQIEESRFGIRCFIPDEQGNPIGRLHISLQPGFRRSDEKPMFVLTLTSRGKPSENSTAGIFQFLDAGRKFIVLGFTAITTPKMHTIWGRKDG